MAEIIIKTKDPGKVTNNISIKCLVSIMNTNKKRLCTLSQRVFNDDDNQSAGVLRKGSSQFSDIFNPREASFYSVSFLPETGKRSNRNKMKGKDI